MNQPHDASPRPSSDGRAADDPAGADPPREDVASEAPTRLENVGGTAQAPDNQRLLAGRYRLEQLLGRGSMGAVWKAHDVVLRRSVAVKEVLLPPTQSDEENAISRERALREARAIAALSHPNVVTLFDVVEDDGRPWVVMELVPARSLAAIIAEDGPLAPVEAARIGLAVLDALDSAHEVGITHRDVKPGNILVSRDGRVKLADFGISRKVDESQLTRTGLMVGSPSYIAPEVARGRDAGRAADIWGLGATLHCAVEGEPPFDLGDPVATLTAVVGDPPRPAPHAGPLGGILHRCLDKDPRTRMRSEELRHALQAVLSRRTAPAPTLPPPPPPPRPPTTPVPARTVGHALPSRPAPPAARPATQPPGLPAGPARPGYPPALPTGPVIVRTAPPPHSGPMPTTSPQRENGRGWVIGLSIALIIVIVAGVLVLLLREDTADNGNGSGPSGSGQPSTSESAATTTTTPTSNNTTIDGTTASGAIKVGSTFYPFSFTVPAGWSVAKVEDNRTELIETGSDATDAGLIKVTVVAEQLIADSVDAQIESQRTQVGSPAKLSNFLEVDYRIEDDGAILWQYTNTSLQGSPRRGYFYAFEGPKGILWKVILLGPVDEETKLREEIINPILASMQTG